MLSLMKVDVGELKCKSYLVVMLPHPAFQILVFQSLGKLVKDSSKLSLMRLWEMAFKQSDE